MMKRNIKLLFLGIVMSILWASFFLYFSFADDYETTLTEERNAICSSLKNISISKTSWKGTFTTEISWESTDTNIVVKQVGFKWFCDKRWTDCVIPEKWSNKAKYTYKYSMKGSSWWEIFHPSLEVQLLSGNYWSIGCSIRNDWTVHYDTSKDGYDVRQEIVVYDTLRNGKVEEREDCDSHQLWCHFWEWKTPTCFLRPIEESFSPQQWTAGETITAKYAIDEASAALEFWIYSNGPWGSAKDILDLYGIDLYRWDGAITKDAKPMKLWFRENDFTWMWENERAYRDNIKNNTWVNQHTYTVAWTYRPYYLIYNKHAPKGDYNDYLYVRRCELRGTWNANVVPYSPVFQSICYKSNANDCPDPDPSGRSSIPVIIKKNWSINNSNTTPNSNNQANINENFEVSPHCGDGKNNQSYEECDDGNTRNGDGCSSNCRREIPSCDNLDLKIEKWNNNLKVDVGWTIDNNFWVNAIDWWDGEKQQINKENQSTYVYNKEGTYWVKIYVYNKLNNSKKGYCEKKISFNEKECGNGLIENLEECDDGNTRDGDWCSKYCKLRNIDCNEMLSGVKTTVNQNIVKLSLGELDGFNTTMIDFWNKTLKSNNLRGEFNNTYFKQGQYTIKFKIENKNRTSTYYSDKNTTYCEILINITNPSEKEKQNRSDYLAEKDTKNIWNLDEEEHLSASDYPETLIEAYNWAYEKKITTLSPIRKADLKWWLFRGHMAKMISEFAIQVLGMQPDTSKECSFLDISSETEEIKGYIKQACQLWLMGYNKDGKTKKSYFEPKKRVSVAQFSTLLSRMLWWDTYNDGLATNYYIKHMTALKENGLLSSNNNPNQIQIRWKVLEMLKKSYDLKK